MLALVADDDASVRKLVSRCLERLGWTVRAFDSAQALLEAFRRRKPGLVVSDIDMPGKLNGVEACRAIRAESRETAVILITGNPGNASGIGEREFDRILVKPFRLAELEKAASRKLQAKA